MFVALETASIVESSVLKDALVAAMNNIKGDVLDTMASALPIGLGIAGTLMAVRITWSFFRGIAH